MSGQFDAATFAAHLDLTGPGRIRIDPGPSTAHRTLSLGSYGSGVTVSLHLAPGSLEALRDAITAHLDPENSP